MICKKCLFNVNEGTNICPNCGSQLEIINSINNNNINNTQVNNGNQSNQNNIRTVFNSTNSFGSVIEKNDNNSSEDIQNDDLVQVYIGKNADKLLNNGFSFNTLLFGILYILYRKMWLLALIWSFITTVSIVLLKKGAIIVIILMTIIFALTFKNLYVRYVNKRIVKIKNKHSDKTKEQLMVICRKRGGTTIISVIIYLIIFYSIIYLYDSGNMYNMERIFNLTGSSSDNISQTGIIDNLDLTIPDNFIMSNYNTDDSKSYSTGFKKNADYCSLRLDKVLAKVYDYSAKKYLDRKRLDILSVANYDTSGIKKIKINKKTWYYELYNSDGLNHYIYSTVNNDYIYTFDFKVYSDNNKTCYSAYNTMINSLKFK